MNEFDLQSAWEQNHDKAGHWYQNARAQVLERAQQRASRVTRRVQRFFWLEQGMSVVFMLGALLFTGYLPGWIIAAVVLLFGAISVSWMVSYRRLMQEIKEIPTLDVAHSLQRQAALLRQYYGRLLRLLVIITPFALLTGFVAGFLFGEGRIEHLFQSKVLYLGVPTLLVLGVVAYFASKWYYDKILGREISELEKTLEGLQEAPV